jgi:precorrin-6A synthase
VKRVLVIGIGAGNPEHVTIQAVNALNEVDVFFVIDKGETKSDLARLRREICERYIKDRAYRVVEADDPVRDRSGPAYRENVEAWRQKRVALCAKFINDELKDGECGGFLVWGDPALYDGTILVLQQILAEGSASFEYEIIPGISSVQALAAAHRIPLNRIGEAIQVTTGRRLAAEGMPAGVDNLVVMLDTGDAALKAARDDDPDIYWGAYLGTDGEILVSGKLLDRIDEIERTRKEKRAERGWIMDTYLLRRHARER